MAERQASDQLENETEQMRDGTPDTVPTKEPDAALYLTDDGITMPEFLKGYVGEFKIRTPNITGELETTDEGLPTDDVYDGVIANYPESGDYHGDLREGLLAISTPRHPETVFEVIDEREEGDA